MKHLTILMILCSLFSVKTFASNQSDTIYKTPGDTGDVRNFIANGLTGGDLRIIVVDGGFSLSSELTNKPELHPSIAGNISEDQYYQCFIQQSGRPLEIESIRMEKRNARYRAKRALEELRILGITIEQQNKIFTKFSRYREDEPEHFKTYILNKRSEFLKERKNFRSLFHKLSELNENKGHGFKVASVIADMLPDSEIIPISNENFYDGFSDSDYQELRKTLEIVSKTKVDAVNISYHPKPDVSFEKTAKFVRLIKKIAEKSMVFMAIDNESGPYGRYEYHKLIVEAAKDLIKTHGFPRIILTGNIINPDLSIESSTAGDGQNHIIFTNGQFLLPLIHHAGNRLPASGTSAASPYLLSHFLYAKQLWKNQLIAANDLDQKSIASLYELLQTDLNPDLYGLGVYHSDYQSMNRKITKAGDSEWELTQKPEEKPNDSSTGWLSFLGGFLY